MNTKIYVVTHKSFIPPKDTLYEPIQVGKYFTKVDLGFLSDDTEDNIAEKNKNYCELTALYWMWKNDKTTETIGLCHYRRYFTKKVFSRKESFFLDINNITSILKEYDVIVPKEVKRSDITVREFYSYCEGKDKDILLLRECMMSHYPEYVDSYDAILNGKKAFYCNMFILSKKLFDEYCQWLFTLLFDLEEKIDISDYTPQQARVYGYLSELLLNVWIKHKKLKYKEIDIVNIEISFLQSIKDKIVSFLKRMLKKMRSKQK